MSFPCRTYWIGGICYSAFTGRPIPTRKEPMSKDPTITQQFETLEARLTGVAAALADPGLQVSDVAEIRTKVEEASDLQAEIRTRLRGCWIDPATDEENIEGAARGAAGEFGPISLETQIGRIIPSTCKTRVELSLARGFAGSSPSATIEVETTGMSAGEIVVANESARDIAEDLADFFAPKVVIGPTDPGKASN